MHWRELDVSRCCWPKFVTWTILVFTIKSIVAIFFFYNILPTKRWKNIVYPRKSFANLLRGKKIKVKYFSVTVPSHRYLSIISIVFVQSIWKLLCEKPRELMLSTKISDIDDFSFCYDKLTIKTLLSCFSFTRCVCTQGGNTYCIQEKVSPTS